MEAVAVKRWRPLAFGRLASRYDQHGMPRNAFANVSWTFGLHDRPWGPVRPVFGTVRYMNAAGLNRKFDMQAYVTKIATVSR